MSMFASLYAMAAAARRRSFQRGGRQRRLRQPVVSVGNLRVGGTGKTPAVACVSRVLIGMGERPAILSRGYGRRVVADGVVVVSDGQRLLAGLDVSGDEPLLLARAVEQARVLVSADRYLAGRLAELRLGATVHVLDDGFQHLPLARGTDLLIAGAEDLEDPRTLPTGCLREPLEAAAAADAILVPDATDEQASAIASRLRVSRAFRMVREPGTARWLEPAGDVGPASAKAPAFAVAGVARPDRFFRELGKGGWDVTGTVAFPDHHRFRASDVARLADAARAAGASVIVTTEKDAVRLEPFQPLPLPCLFVPLAVRIEPEAAFRQWLGRRLADERSRRERTSA